jgi:hypothetical protein
MTDERAREKAASYEFHIVCRIHGYHGEPWRYDDAREALRAVDSLSVTDCGVDAILVINQYGRAYRAVAAEPGAMRALLEAAAEGRTETTDLAELQRYATRIGNQRVRDIALFEDLEEVTRALIAQAPEPRVRLYELLDVASIAYHDGRHMEALSALGQLHTHVRHREGP